MSKVTTTSSEASKAPKKTAKKTEITANTSKKKEEVSVSQKAKKSPIQEKDTVSKVLKSDELLWWWGFLSWLGFKKVEKTQKQTEEEKRIEEEEQESIVLEKPRRANFSFDKVEMSSKKIVWREDSSFAWKEKRPAIPRAGKPYQKPTKPYRAPQRGDQPHRSFAKWPIGRPQFSQGRPRIEKTYTPPPQRVKVQKIATTSANLVKKTEVFIDDKITVKEFSEKMWVPLPLLMKKLIENKIMTGITASLDFDTAALIALEFDVLIKKHDDTVDVQTFMSGDLQAILDLDKEASTLLPRSPIVTVMWHVDHGKTSLLDYLRHTVIAEWEAGGITQWIWASVVEHDGKKICFIDTPGHELFTSLRARWAKLTNIAIIVIASDDSVMPQTIESIWHAKDSGVPIIVAITKIDKPGKKIDQIKQDLAKYGLIPEDWWWDTPMIGISSKTGQGIPELLEAVLLQTEMLDLKYNPDRSAVWVVVDAHKDPKQWVVSTIIIMTGTLHVWDTIVAYNTTGKIRRMQNRKGQSVKSVSWWEPVQVLGINQLPEPGRIVEVVKNEKEAHEKITLIQEHVHKHTKSSVVQQFISQLQSWKVWAELKLILKSDGSSSLEALQQAVSGIELPKNVTIKIIQANVGHFSDSDLSLAQASGALLLGFNISINAILKKKADNLKIEMKNFDIIYELTEYLSKLLLGMVEIEQHEVMFSKLEVLGIFFTKNKDMTIWGKIMMWKLHGKPKFTVMRPAPDGTPEGEDIFCTGTVVSIHKNKDQIKETPEGEECGLKVLTSKKIEIGDILEFFEMQDVIDDDEEDQAKAHQIIETEIEEEAEKKEEKKGKQKGKKKAKNKK